MDSNSILQLHFSCAYPALGTEMTNKYLNNFLESIDYPERVDLSLNLDYRRKKFYLQGKWNIEEMQAISALILKWPFYTSLERVKYLIIFWLKSIFFLMIPFKNS
ncbi:MAG: hypothetical protein GVY04_16075 [Cyanobacteria bacterium]|jgi:hypothetical protein|nr:hypothetical protein [Cyanobacteria bacterium GSL.Bin1]